MYLHAEEGQPFDRSWAASPELRPRCYRSQHEKDTWMSVCVQDEYKTPRFEPNDLVLDIGSHMGSFAMRAWLNGSRRIQCWEPDEPRWEAWTQNLAGCDGLTLHREKVWPLDRIIGMYGPVRFLKIDCEGCEWALFYKAKRLRAVQEISGEFHELHPTPQRIDELCFHLAEHFGFYCEYQRAAGDAHLGLFHAWRVDKA